MANEAGQGAVDRGSNSTGYSYLSLASATATDDCTRLAVYAECSASQAIKFGFFTLAGNDATQVSATYTFDSGAGGNKVYEFNAPADFTAFAVTTGWYLVCYVQGVQTFASSAGVGMWYKSIDVFTGSSENFTLGSGWLDGLEADIGAAPGGNAPTADLQGSLVGPLGGPIMSTYF